MTQLLDTLTSNQELLAVIVAIVGACLALWLAAAWWAYADLSRRVRPELLRLLAPAWILLSTPVLLPLSLAAYLLVRPHETVADRRSREILGALLPTIDAAACPGCGGPVEDGWRRCPDCTTWLGAPCSKCERWSPVDLEICPFCATDWGAEAGAPAELPDLVAVPIVPDSVAPDPVATAPAPLHPWNRAARGDRRAGRAASASGPRLARIGR